MSSDRPLDLEALLHAVRAIDSALSPSEALDRFVEGSLLAAPRVALFLVRHGRIKGWRCAGHRSEAVERLSGTEFPAHEDWLRRIAEQGDLPSGAGLFGEPVPDFGQDVSDEAASVPLRVGGAVVGLLVAERSRGEAPLRLPILSILAVFAGNRLELDLVRRRTAASAQNEPLAVAPRDEAPTVSTQVSVGSPTRPATHAETGLVPVSEESGPTHVPTGRHEDARRFARLVATDIRLYNEEAVLMGRRRQDLARRLADQLQRGRESFLRRFPDLGPGGLALLEEAYLEVLAAGDPRALSS